MTNAGRYAPASLTSSSNAADAAKIQRLISYLDVVGMYETVSNGTVSTRSETNKDSYTWKHYPTQLRQNTHGLPELTFNLTDVVLKGSADSTTAIEYYTNRLQVRKNQTFLPLQAFNSCLTNEACPYRADMIMDVT